MGDPVDYEAVLADLVAKRVALDNAILAVQQILGLASIDTAGPAADKPETKSPSDSHPYFGMAVSDAIKKYLRLEKGPRQVNTISTALIEGGMQTLSKNFYTSVYAALQREEDQAGGFVRVSKKEWGLAEWYPGRIKA